MRRLYTDTRSVVHLASSLSEEFSIGTGLELLLFACAITHHSYVQSIVLEPCSRLIVSINEASDPLRRSVDGTASTGDVICRLFGMTVTTVVRGQSPAQHVCPKPESLSRLVGIDIHRVRCLMVWAWTGAVSCCWMPTAQPNLHVFSAPLFLVEGQRTLA